MRTSPIPLLLTPLLFALYAQAGATTVRVHYDAGCSAIEVRGDKGPMSWDKGAAAQRGAGNTWTYTWPDNLGDIVMKPTLGADKVSIGGVYKLAAGSTVDVYPFFGAPFGKVVVVPKFESPQLKNSRSLRVYLPPSYDENRAKRYPVLYMHDGQNLFDARTAAFGTEWRVDENINWLVATGAMDEVIVVGIDNTPERIAEYTPCCDPKERGGKIDAYRAFIVDTVKPYVDKTWRTLPGRQSTAVMGSSLGGVASVTIAQMHPEVFSKAAGVSSSFWWNRRAMVQQPAARVPVSLYIDAGTVNDGIEDTRAMKEVLLRQGYVEGKDLMYHEAAGAGHNEKSWAARVEKPLVWFFPWGAARQ